MEDRQMTLEQLLRTKSGPDGSRARVAFEDRWVVFSGFGDQWIVYQRKYGMYKTKALFAGGLHDALEVLEQGFVKMNATERKPLSPGYLLENPDIGYPTYGNY